MKVNSISFQLILRSIAMNFKQCSLMSNSSVWFCSESRAFERPWFGGDSPVCRDLVISSYQKYITQLLVLKIGLHLSKGLFRMVCGLEKLIWAVGAHPGYTVQSQPVGKRKTGVELRPSDVHSCQFDMAIW